MSAALTTPNPAAMRKIVGVDSSPVVNYPGLGSYFLDKFADGHWRLEVYPAAKESRTSSNSRDVRPEQIE